MPLVRRPIGQHTGAASAYVGMTRGREANAAHLVAADADEAARYSAPRPLEEVVAGLHRAWTDEHGPARLLPAAA